MSEFTGKFHIGQIVRHRRFGYRGVVYDADPEYMLSEDWYQSVALSRPPKDRPWYHVLVDGADQVTYVAERNLDAANEDGRPIDHPLIETYFRSFNGRSYEARALSN